MKRRKKKLHWEELAQKLNENWSSLIAEYSENIIRICEHDKWDYAIPEMYINYQDGFIFPRCESYKGMPLFEIDGNTLYHQYTINDFRLAPNESEKYLCFDRQNRKYTVIIVSNPEVQLYGNPSYFRFLPKVEKYVSKAERLRRIKEAKGK